MLGLKLAALGNAPVPQQPQQPPPMTPTPSFAHPAPLAAPSVTVDASCPPPTTDLQPGHQAQALGAATSTAPLAPSASTPPAQVTTPITAPSPQTSKSLKGVSAAKQLRRKVTEAPRDQELQNGTHGADVLEACRYESWREEGLRERELRIRRGHICANSEGVRSGWGAQMKRGGKVTSNLIDIKHSPNTIHFTMHNAEELDGLAHEVSFQPVTPHRSSAHRARRWLTPQGLRRIRGAAAL
ncbi:hypothetical protein EDB84DRAFT_1614025 [Lactarius hengduanensis]|nr:hypothetical protein EDB84DRAFT_1614025 [Lactarius hengduanensis]